ncbi:MAG: VCBS repeat-containing protein [Acidobacteria bacterium]|nr:VCBS repeat-containing protein [Acidobacteriota bacterium]
MAGDLNSDNRLDLILTSPVADSVFILLGHATDLFRRDLDIPVRSSPTFIAIEDFNLDGLADLAITTETPNVFILLNRLRPDLTECRP